MRFASIARTVLGPGGGTGLEFRGDEVMAVFTSARQAIRAAIREASSIRALAAPVGSSACS